MPVSVFPRGFSVPPDAFGPISAIRISSQDARKPLHVQVRLQFAVELLVRGVFVVEADDRVGVVGKVRPPERDLDVGEKHVVRLRLDHLVDAEERTVLRALRLHVRDDAAPDRHVRSLPVVPVGLRRAVRIALRLSIETLP